MLKEKLTFDVDIKGSESEQRFAGSFIIKTKLSWQEMARQDEVRRQLLGFNPNEAPQFLSSAAQSAAYLAIHVIDSPPWWKNTNNGFNMEDLNVLNEVYQKASNAVEAEYKKLADEAEAAKAALKKESEKA